MTSQWTEVLSSVLQFKYDLVIMNYKMPLRSGPDVCEQIRTDLSAKGIERKSQPFVALLTTCKDKKYKSLSLSKQADMCLVKPLYKDHIL